MKHLKYSMYIRWSEEDQCFIVWLPEFGPTCHTHGATYEEAAKRGREVLELLVDGNCKLPEPYLYGGGQSITPPAHEGRALDADWYEKAMRRLDSQSKGKSSSLRAPQRAKAAPVKR